MDHLSTVAEMWGDRSGYVFIPRAKRTPGVKRADRWDEGKAYRWPDERKALEDRVRISITEGWDVYFSPWVWEKPERKKGSELPDQGWAYADLDTCSPELVEPKPTLVLQSSEGHWQAFWQLGRDEPSARIEAVCYGIAHKYAKLGADISGWDISQVLRMPGSFNHKYDPPYRVTGLSYGTVHELTALPSETPPTKLDAEGVEIPVEEIDRLLAPYRLSHRAKELAFSTVATGDRSERLWELAKLLIESGVPIAIAVPVLKASVWNKYKGRADEDKRLMTDALKAEREYRESLASDKLEVVTLPTGEKEISWPLSYTEFMLASLPEPAWLVENIWYSYGMIAGEPKTYKSFIAMDMQASVSSGKPFLGVFPVPAVGATLYINEENDAASVQKRARLICRQKGLIPSEAMAIPPDLPMYFSNNVGFDLTNAEHRDQLELAIQNLKLVLVVIDPLINVLGGVDENNAKELRPVLKFLQSLRDKHRCGVLLIHHFRKAQQGVGKLRGGQKARGSGAFHGWVESALYTELLADGIRVEREFRSFPKQPDLKISIGVDDEGWYEPAVLSDETGGTTATEIKKEEIISLLADKRDGLDFDSLKTSLRTSRPRLQTWLRELKDEGIVDTVKRGRGTFYVLTAAAKTEKLEEESV